jgi:hypothetical protein
MSWMLFREFRGILVHANADATPMGIDPAYHSAGS